MIIPYLPSASGRPVPSLGGALIRWRSVTAVRISGPSDTWLCDGLLDSGADDTVFEEDLAGLIGVDLTQAESRQLVLAGRPKPITCRYAPVELRVTDGQEAYTWLAVVGFVQTRLRYPLLGHAGFLQFFNVEFQGADRRAVLMPNHSFSGAVS